MDLCLYFRTLVLLSILAIAAVTDTVAHRVGNRLILTGYLFLILTYAVSPPETDPFALGYALMFLMVLFLFFVLRKLGAADIKLYMLIILAFPNGRSLEMIVLSIVLSAFWSCILLFRRMPVISGPAAKFRIEDIQGIPMGLFLFMAACLVLLQ